MHKTVQNLINIKNQINDNLNNLNINNQIKIVASKTFSQIKFYLLLNMVILILVKIKFKRQWKWSEIKIKNEKIKLHMIGNLQTNKVKYAVKIFDYIHPVDTEKLAKFLKNK